MVVKSFFFFKFQALDGFLMIVDHTGTVLYVSDDSADYISLTPVSTSCVSGSDMM